MHFKYFWFYHKWYMYVNVRNVYKLHIMQAYTYLFQQNYISDLWCNQRKSDVNRCDRIYCSISTTSRDALYPSSALNYLELQQGSKLTNKHSGFVSILHLNRILQKSCFYCVYGQWWFQTAENLGKYIFLIFVN